MACSELVDHSLAIDDLCLVVDSEPRRHELSPSVVEGQPYRSQTADVLLGSDLDLREQPTFDGVISRLE